MKVKGLLYYLHRYRLFVLHKLPGLKFLDCKAISGEEQAESFHSGHVALTHRLSKRTPVSTSVDEVDSLDAKEEEKSKFGRLKYRYVGKYSEGNRFISDRDL